MFVNWFFLGGFSAIYAYRKMHIHSVNFEQLKCLKLIRLFVLSFPNNYILGPV